LLAAEGCHEACLIGCDHIAAAVPARNNMAACTTPTRGGRLFYKLRCATGYKPDTTRDFGCIRV
jgi:hypothetical protein